jgi:peptidoglycan hydrolase-like protein with peptidoglycan-binding domain
MILRFILGVVLMGSLAGCATTQKPAASSQLQIRVAHIENQLDDHSQDIAQLQSEVERLSSNSQATRASIPLSSKDQKTLKPASLVTSETDPYQQILRVPVAPKEVQKALTNANYYTGAIDGKLGSGSQKAIKEFQKDHGLQADGIIGKKTWDALKSYL